ncbi:sensor histidine kinase [Brevibacterium yomogidense]|uniref:histidine kinase n=1 Tax=Brevibacterium yomogidense TaxID=946573 RepID=A0A1X6XIR1_9MICO|nr:histidine kinase [Brevibacterium yomogidense]SLM99023.1 two component sensor kinase [Brevibacterium yomogidense]
MNTETSATPAMDVAHRMRGERRRRVLRTAGYVAVGLLLFVVGIVVSSLSTVGVPGAFDANGELSSIGVLIVLVVWILWATVFVRTRWPWIPLAAGALSGLAGGDVLLLLIGMFHSVIRLPRRTAIITTAVGAAVVVWSIVWACLRHPALNPFAFFFVPEPQSLMGVDTPEPLPGTALGIDLLTIGVGVVALAVAVGVGFLVRRTRRMRTVEAVAVRQTERSESLSDELARQKERQLLAQELHDTLSHRLSVISLHSGALEVAGDDQRSVDAAAALRREAKASLDDLRDLVSGVREGTPGAQRPAAGDSSAPVVASVRTVPDLVDSVTAAGVDLRPVLLLQDLESVPTVLDRAVYRIVQEALTNAMKHAPGVPVSVDVRVSAREGARIVVSNPLSVQPSGGDARTLHDGVDLSGTGGGMGVPGIEERARMLGGQAAVGPRGDAFVVDVQMPPFADRGAAQSAGT